jgi:hypothetical protein
VNHPNDLAPVDWAAEPDPFANRIFLSEISPREGFVDDRDGWCVGLIVCGEITAGDQSHTHDAEIIRARGAENGHRPFVRRGQGPSFHIEAVELPPNNGTSVDGASSANTGTREPARANVEKRRPPVPLLDNARRGAE